VAAPRRTQPAPRPQAAAQGVRPSERQHNRRNS
jgi:hypothetical protein